VQVCAACHYELAIDMRSLELIITMQAVSRSMVVAVVAIALARRYRPEAQAIVLELIAERHLECTPLPRRPASPLWPSSFARACRRRARYGPANLVRRESVCALGEWRG
jgi:hypothetical protein